MTIWLEGRAAALSVTLIAVSSTIGIMRPGAAYESCGGMTEMAIQRGRNVVVILTGRSNPMAGRAIINDASMIKHRSDESTGVMTDTAILVS